MDRLPVAFVNQESREEILRHYIRLYQSVEAPNLHVSLCHGTALQLPNTIYFDPKLDTPTLPTQFNHLDHIYLDHKLQTSPCLLTYLSVLFPTYNPLAVQAYSSASFPFSLSPPPSNLIVKLGFIHRNILTKMSERKNAK